MVHGRALLRAQVLYRGKQGASGDPCVDPGKETVHRNSTGSDTLSVRGSGHPTVHPEDAGQS